ncbi:hypothetical protein JHK87_015542 [Glycine soja]|uniref:Uncharacterized protein n=1 Tax=Glycine max TaxID=3847 RepID=K7KVP9_SOYBN|nr:hypothetical protein JHK87_015542 [Glycine soja]
MLTYGYQRRGIGPNPKITNRTKSKRIKKKRKPSETRFKSHTQHHKERSRPMTSVDESVLKIGAVFRVSYGTSYQFLGVLSS